MGIWNILINKVNIYGKNVANDETNPIQFNQERSLFVLKCDDIHVVVVVVINIFYIKFNFHFRVNSKSRFPRLSLSFYRLVHSSLFSSPIPIRSLHKPRERSKSNCWIRTHINLCICYVSSTSGPININAICLFCSVLFLVVRVSKWVCSVSAIWHHQLIWDFLIFPNPICIFQLVFFSSLFLFWHALASIVVWLHIMNMIYRPVISFNRSIFDSSHILSIPRQQKHQ